MFFQLGFLLIVSFFSGIKARVEKTHRQTNKFRLIPDSSQVEEVSYRVNMNINIFAGAPKSFNRRYNKAK